MTYTPPLATLEHHPSFPTVQKHFLKERASLECITRFPTYTLLLSNLECLQNASLKQPDGIIYFQYFKQIFCTRLLLKAKYFSTSINLTRNWSYLCSSLVNWYFVIVQCNYSTSTDMFVNSLSTFFHSRKLPLKWWCWEVF